MMKNTILMILLCIIGFSTNSFAQIEVKINPIGALFQSPDVSTEFILAESIGVEAKIGYGWGSNTFGTETSKYSGLVFAGLGKFYVNPREGADRFYVAPYAKVAFNNSSSSVINDEYSQTRLALGLAIGQKWVTPSNIVFDVNFGAGRALINNIKYNGTDDDFLDFLENFTRFDLIGTIAVGYRFGS